MWPVPPGISEVTVIILSFSLFADVGFQQTLVFPWMAQSQFPGFQ